MNHEELPIRNQSICNLARVKVSSRVIAAHFGLTRQTIQRIVFNGTVPGHHSLDTPEQKAERQIRNNFSYGEAPPKPRPLPITRPVYGKPYCRYIVKYVYGCGDFVSKVAV